MALTQRVFFTLYETSVRWDCSISDIAGWAAVGKLKIKTGIGLVRCGEAVVAEADASNDTRAAVFAAALVSLRNRRLGRRG